MAQHTNSSWTEPVIPHRMVTMPILARRHLMVRTASLSRDLQPHWHSSPPVLVHSLSKSHGSILSLAASQDYIFSGSQNQDISVSQISL